MSEQSTNQRRPFHKTIIDAIRGASNDDALMNLGDLIKATKIPKGHDEIIAAWKQRIDRLGSPTIFSKNLFQKDYGVPADLLEQKQEAEKKKEEKKAKEQVEAATS